MIRAFTGIDPGVGHPLMEQVWRFRHRWFVERFGWQDLKKDDGREIDQFDTKDAVHLVLCGKDDRVVGYSRLLKTSAPHLLSDVYPDLMGGMSWPTGATIYEWTRCVADPQVMLEGVSATNMLSTGVLEFCLTAGISALIVETHPKLLEAMVEFEWNAVPLCAPQMYGNNMLVVIHAGITARALMAHHRNYGVTGSVLDLSHEPANPLRPGETLRRLPYLETTQADIPLVLRIAGE